MAVSRPPPRARWATCALALLTAAAVVVPTAVADPKKPARKRPPKASVATCAFFDQVDREDEAVDLVIDNRCDAKLSCSVSWTLLCAPGTRKAQRFQRGAQFPLDRLASQATTASATECGNDGWVIDDVVWQCKPEPRPEP
jgi:hypothetical protein